MSQTMRPYLEFQADRVEAVLAVHRAPGRITGGTVGPRLIRFFLNPAPHIRFASIRRLADDLALAMRVPNLSVDRSEEGVVLTFPNPEPRSVRLLSLLPEVLPQPSCTALLGLTDDGTPILARLSSPLVSHVLVAGTTGSGKSVLLRTLVASLALTNSPDVLQMLCVDPKGRTFRALRGLPHFIRPVVTDMAEAAEALRSLVRMMEARDRLGESPRDGRVSRILVCIDELADLIMLGEEVLTDAVTRLLQRGREAGIHVVAATQHPSAAILSGLMRANFPLRLVGRVVASHDARVASGRGGTNAHLLNGHGDFLAVCGGDTPTRFQVAYIEERELRQQVMAVRRAQPRKPALTAEGRA